MSEEIDRPDVVHLSSWKFFSMCVAAAIGVLFVGRTWNIPSWVIGLEVLATVIALFIFGSIRYRLDKNALTYGAALVIIATFFTIWWSGSGLRQALQAEGFPALARFAGYNLLTLDGLDKLVHADTMLFILGLTFFVAVIGQTRLLESMSFAVLSKNRGRVFPTIAVLAAAVSFFSGILDGVSMIGLMIRTLIIILFLAKATHESSLYAVVISTVVTTVCGMWLAYGEPPNLIMKSNLQPHLNDAFFLKYCLPIAVASYIVVFFNMRRKFGRPVINMKKLDVVDLHTADVRFLQASRHGKVLSALEFVHENEALLQKHTDKVARQLQKGVPLGAALIEEGVPEKVRLELLREFTSEQMAGALNVHYATPEDSRSGEKSLEKIEAALAKVRSRRIKAQAVGGIAFIPFIGLLVWHAIDHSVPLFWSSMAGFAVAFLGIMSIPRLRSLALREAKHEYTEYLFLLPLFLSITLLQKSGFFDEIGTLLRLGIDKVGVAHMAFGQFAGTTFLSAILDNNVVADFAGRALHGLSIGTLHLFAMAQIAGYAVGGCWTHIGSAQSVVAYSFLRKELDETFTPFQWIKIITPIVLEIFVIATIIVYVRAVFFP